MPCHLILLFDLQMAAARSIGFYDLGLFQTPDTHEHRLKQLPSGIQKLLQDGMTLFTARRRWTATVHFTARKHAYGSRTYAIAPPLSPAMRGVTLFCMYCVTMWAMEGPTRKSVRSPHTPAAVASLSPPILNSTCAAMIAGSVCENNGPQLLGSLWMSAFVHEVPP